jgi:hypothetical protein
MSLRTISLMAVLVAMGACEAPSSSVEEAASVDAWTPADAAAAAAACAAGLPDPRACDPADTKKATVCHVPPGNPANEHTICVGTAAVDAHLAHGDHLGSCCPTAPTPPPAPPGTGAGGAGGGSAGAGGAGGTGGSGGAGAGGAAGGAGGAGGGSAPIG